MQLCISKYSKESVLKNNLYLVDDLSTETEMTEIVNI